MSDYHDRIITNIREYMACPHRIETKGICGTCMPAVLKAIDSYATEKKRAEAIAVSDALTAAGFGSCSIPVAVDRALDELAETKRDLTGARDVLQQLMDAMGLQGAFPVSDLLARATRMREAQQERERSMVHSCEWTTSNLSLAVERPTDWIGAIVPSIRATMPVDYCRRCGLIRMHSLELVENKTDASIPAQPEKQG